MKREIVKYIQSEVGKIHTYHVSVVDAISRGSANEAFDYARMSGSIATDILAPVWFFEEKGCRQLSTLVAGSNDSMC